MSGNKLAGRTPPSHNAEWEGPVSGQPLMASGMYCWVEVTAGCVQFWLSGHVQRRWSRVSSARPQRGQVHLSGSEEARMAH